MKNKILLIIFAITALVSVSFMLGYLNSWYSFSFIIGFIIPAYMMVSDSKILKTIYGKIMLIGSGIFFSGTRFNIQHYPCANIIMLVITFVAFVLMITYFIRFIKKETKHLLD